MNLRQAPLLAIGFLAAMPALAFAADWPQFRGPDGQGHSGDRGLPTTWSETENIVWKTPIEGLGWSSPTVAGDQIWLTTAIEESRSLRAVCIELESGQVVRDVEVFRKADLGSINAKNSHASPTPVIEGDSVYVHFGAHGTACLSRRDGRVVWRNEELKYNHRHGPAGSPVIWKDLLIFSCDGTDVQFVVALDKRTGDIRWQTDRTGRMAYSTPLVIRVGRDEQLVSVGGDQVAAYDPATGKEIWKFRYDGYSVVPRPVFAHGLVILSSGYDTPTLYAVRPDGHGDVTDTHGQWTLRRAAPHNPSPLVVGDELYLVSDLGVASCVDAAHRRAALELASGRRLLGLAAVGGRQNLLHQRGRPDDRDGRGQNGEEAGREQDRRPHAGLAGDHRPFNPVAQRQAPVSH